LPWLVAAAVHLAIPLVARHAPRSARPMLALASGVLRGTEIEIEVPVRAIEERGGLPVDGTVEEASSADRRVRRGRAVAVLGADPGAGVAEPGEHAAPPTGEPAPAPGPSDGYDQPPDDGRDAVLAPGVGGTPVWAIPGAIAQPDLPRPAPTTVPARRAPDRDAAGRVLRDVQTSRDKGIGIDLPAAGTVASAVAEAVRSTDTPQVGRASYEVRLGANGQVLGVRLLRAVGGHADSWERAARLVAARLARSKLLMTGAYTSGAVVIVDVSSVVQLPAGPGGSGVVKPGPPPGTVGGGGQFDLSNIGAHPSRVVSTSFRSRPLQ
jgi:hypothetical protein